MFIFTPNTLIKSSEINSNFTNALYTENHTNRCMFLAYRNGAWTAASNAYAHIIFDTKVYDVGNVFDTSNGRFTVPFDGYYFLHANITTNTLSGAGIYGAFYKNGNQLALGGQDVPVSYTGAFGTSVAVTITVYLLKNDYINAGYYGNSQAGQTGLAATRFEGRFISK